MQAFVVEALLTEDPQFIYHATMMDPLTVAELDIDQIWELVDALREAHEDWLPKWVKMSSGDERRPSSIERVAF